MDFDTLATLNRNHPSSAGLSEQGALRVLVRKVLDMSHSERQQCSIAVGDFIYRRAEIEALTRHPDFSDPQTTRDDSSVVLFRRPRRA
jgi:hypothetical protein